MTDQPKDGAARLPTLGLCAIVDGRLMGDIGEVYEVISHFIGRPTYTHELPKYSRLAAAQIAAAFPAMSGRENDPWQDVRAAVLAEYGASVDVPDEWAGSATDGKGPIANIADAMLEAHK